MKSAIIWLLIGSITWGSKSNKCVLESTGVISLNHLGDKILVHLEPDRPILYQGVLPNGKFLKKARAEVLSHNINTSQAYLIRRQLEIFKKNNDNLGKLPELFDAVASQVFGNIKPVNCLEALLYDLHLSLQRTKHSTEFCAALYKFKINGKPYLKIILSSNNKPNAPNLTPELLKENKTVWALLHNHFFAFDTKTGDVAGTLVPSGYAPPGSFLTPVADLGYFRQVAKKFGLNEAWITNGFDSSHFMVMDPNNDGNYWIY